VKLNIILFCIIVFNVNLTKDNLTNVTITVCSKDPVTSSDLGSMIEQSRNALNMLWESYQKHIEKNIGPFLDIQEKILITNYTVMLMSTE
jgi:hypothetical protein